MLSRAKNYRSDRTEKLQFAAVSDDAGVRGVRREVWEIAKVWWVLVPGGAFGVVAIVQAIRGARGESIWFWGFWAMTALALALGLRLRQVAQERDRARRLLEDENSTEAAARRLEDLANEALIIRDNEVPAGDDWGTALRRCTHVFNHWQDRADAEIRRSANGYMDHWRQNPPNPMLLRFSSPEAARQMIDFCVAQIRHIATELRKQ